MHRRDLVPEVARTLGDLDRVESILDRAPDEVFAHVVSVKSERQRIKAIIGADPEETSELLERERRLQREKVLENGRAAVRKIRDSGENASLDAGERVATEAIIHVLGRPAILIQDGRFFPPPHPWEELETRRGAIEGIFSSVGRIEVTGHPALDWVGTGFLVAPNVIMTNRHVAKEFSRIRDGQWTFESGMSASVDYKEEFGSAAESVFAVTEVIGIHEQIDLALLRVALDAASSPPPPLGVAKQAPSGVENHRVYVVGYPASDSKRNDPEVMTSVFAGIYNVKRLQPGEIRAIDDGGRVLAHDCSTLGGNSGSCVVDLETNLVVGLHFQGRYLEANHAACLWMLQDDPLVRQAGLEFQDAGAA